ncbi:potassium channel family protein [Leifsonia sp. YAF41]|uniref:potassium channel family protein n=1 Tax=Leifsonia sp. YAF41 TaxID=3233086 RepID=UPI003F9CC6A5
MTDTAPPPVPPAHFWERIVAWTPGYGTVMLLIGVAYALCAAQIGLQPSALALLVQLLTVGVIFRVAEVKKVIRDVATVVLIVAAVGIALVWISGAEGTWVKVAMTAAAVVFYGVAPAAVIGHQIHRDVIDAQTIFAVVAAYILIGMFFTFAYVLASIPGNIFKGEGVGSLSEVLFFSFTSLSTTGYGNFVPVTATGQTLAIAEILAGQLFIGLAIARVVTAWMPRRK